MTTEDLALRTRVEVFYQGVNISQDIGADLLSFSFTDNEHGKADDINITLKNDHEKWIGPWLPERGDTISATIVQEGRGRRFSLACGKFTVDELEASGPPSVAAIKGVSIPLDVSILRQQKTRAWQDVRLSKIAEDVATTGGLALLYLVENDPLYDRRDQRDESDMNFLKRLCETESYSLKCTDEQLIVFSPEKQGESDGVVTIKKGVSDIKSWRFTAQSHDVYQKCTVEYLNPKTGKNSRYTYTDPKIKKGKTKKLVERSPSSADAQRRAKAALYEANKKEITGSLEMVGDTRLVSGATVYVIGFGQFDGKYYIATATHTVGSGYTTSLELTNTKEIEPGDVPAAAAKSNKQRDDGLDPILNS